MASAVRSAPAGKSNVAINSSRVGKRFDVEIGPLAAVTCFGEAKSATGDATAEPTECSRGKKGVAGAGAVMGTAPSAAEVAATRPGGGASAGVPARRGGKVWVGRIGTVILSL